MSNRDESFLIGVVMRRQALLWIACVVVAFGGCEWVASFGVPQEIREKGLLTALEKPMPLDQPFQLNWPGMGVEHESEMRALLARMEEFADGLQDPTLRATYVQSLKNGEPSRTRAFYSLYVNQSGDIAGSDKQFGLWERIDEGLAEGTEPELVDERIIALAAFAPHGEPTTAARFTEAVRDGWNPESENWRLPFAAIYDPADGVWSPLWEAASQKDLDNEMGDAILARLAWFETPLSNHPFAAPEQIERLARRMRESEDEEEVSRLTGQILSLDAESAGVLWKAACERPVGRSRLSAAYEYYWKRTRSPEAVDYLKKVAAEEERYAIEALHCLSRMGQLEGVERPTGEKLARAKAYYSVANWCDLPDGAAEAIELTPVVSGKATVAGDEMELTVFRYSVPEEQLSAWSFGGKGLIIVDERLVLSPDEMIGIDASGSMGAAIAETSAEAEEPESSFEAAFDEADFRNLLAPDGTVLDLISSANPASMRGYSASADPYGSREQMLAEDERWKVFDIPIGELGFDLEDRDETEAVEPEADAPPPDAEER